MILLCNHHHERCRVKLSVTISGHRWVWIEECSCSSQGSWLVICNLFLCSVITFSFSGGSGLLLLELQCWTCKGNYVKMLIRCSIKCSIESKCFLLLIVDDDLLLLPISNWFVFLLILQHLFKIKNYNRKLNTKTDFDFIKFQNYKHTTTPNEA